MPIYANTLIIKTLQIAEGGQETAVINPLQLALDDQNTKNAGAASIIGLWISPTWLEANLSFTAVDPSAAGAFDPSPYLVTDGLTTSELIIPNIPNGGGFIQIPPFWLCSSIPVSLKSSIAQPDGADIKVFLQPFFQGVA